LKEHEKNHVPHDFKLVAIVHALKMLRHYLMGKRFEFRTNHNGLKYLFEKPHLNVRQTRLLEFLMNLILKSSTSRENKTKLLMHST
jgi:hypothetical protein